MRNLKKFLALVLAMLMIVSASAAVSASDFSDVADDSIYAEAIADLVEKGITNGVAAGQFGPDQPVQRFQMALFMARALEPDVDDWMTGMQVFTDVTEWYGAIAYAYVNNIVTGMGNNLFAPHNGIRYQDALIMALRALGYDVDVSGDPYWLAAYNQAQAIGLTDGVEVFVGEQVLTRAETAQIIFNMLYTTPADGGLTIAAKNFGEQTAANTTTLVVTATPEQYYAETYKAAEDGYLGLQTVIDGLPVGDIMYFTADELGIEEDEIENYFGYAFDFVNFDAKTLKYDRVVIGEDPDVVYNTEITKSGERFTINGKTYYPVDEFTGNVLRNEIIVLNSGELAYARKELYTDKDGNIVNDINEIVADYAFRSSTGTKFYSVTEDGEDESSFKAGDIITESEAIIAFGIAVSGDTYINYSTLDAEDISGMGNYQLTLFDDDHDGEYERGIATKVFVSTFKAKDSDGTESFGPMADDKDVVYTEDLVKGDVFTYTYNTQTKTVNVLDIIAEQTGILDRVNYTDIANENVKLVIDGKDYYLGNTTREAKGLTGANLAGTGNKSYSAITTDGALAYLYDSKDDTAAWRKLVAGSYIRFYAVGDSIINAETFSIDEKFDYAVLKEITTFDSDNVYADMYIDGVLNKNVAIASVEGQELSDMNTIKLSRVINDLANDIGKLFRITSLGDDQYQISEAFDATSKSISNFKLYAVEQNLGTENDTWAEEIIFDDGIADKITGYNGVVDADLVLRTNDDTVFYFLGEDADGDQIVNIYVGAPDNASLNLAGNLDVYADKLGYGTNSYNGVATTVIVTYDYGTGDQINGFGITDGDYSSVVYVFNNKDNAAKGELITASAAGLVGYTGNYVRYEVDNIAIDMQNGNDVDVLYIAANAKFDFEAGEFYNVDKNGVLTSVAASKSTTVDLESYIPGRYQGIDGIFNDDTNNDNVEVDTIKLTMNNTYDVKTNYGDLIKADKEYTIEYINSDVMFDDGIFVGIVTEGNSGSTSSDKTNASYTENGKTYGAIASYNENYDVTVQLYSQPISKIGDKVDSDKKSTTSQASDPNVKIFMSIFDKDSLKFGQFVEISADVEYSNGVLTVKNLTNSTGMVDINLDDNTIYQFRVGIDYAKVGGGTSRIAIDYYINN